MENKKNNKTNQIGGLAVIEGVMMRGKTSMATAVRSESGEILIEAKRIKETPNKRLLKKIPILRGFYAFFSSLVLGTKTLMRSASVFGEEENSKFDDWLSKKTGINATDIAIFFGVVLGVILSVFLFFFMPQFIADLFTFISNTSILYYLIEGLIRIAIFLAYILLTSLVKDIKRTYMYHGAEHKTISCYEKGEELTVENVKKCTRIHDRCGTTFTFLVMIISILLFAVLNVILTKLGVNLNYLGLGKLWRFLCKLAVLPLIAGISYEVLKLLAKSKSKFVIIFKLPGLLLQKITTREPTNDMIEVAIAAFNKTLEMDENPNVLECEFNVFGTSKVLLDKVNKIIYKNGKIDDADGEWIVAHVLNVKRSQIFDKSILVTKELNDKAISLAKQRSQGIPLDYILGESEFYGLKFIVDNNVLIPRPETEELCENALKVIKEGDSVLDMCTGSGAIAVTIAVNSSSVVTAVDVSEKALEIAQKNAIKNNAKINFVLSDMFTNLTGQFNVILSNPPYIKSSDISSLSDIVLKEPTLALDGGVDGLDYYRILSKNAHKFLKNNGYLFMEIGINQDEEVAGLFSNSGHYKSVEIIKDIQGINRIVKVVKNDD